MALGSHLPASWRLQTPLKTSSVFFRAHFQADSPNTFATIIENMPISFSQDSASHITLVATLITFLTHKGATM